MSNRVPNFLLLTILSIGGVSCGGGGDDDGGNTPTGTDPGTMQPTTAQGVFLDSAVEGLDYTSGSLSGLTDSSAGFEYEQNQNVTFSVGGIELGSAAGAATLTPLSLVTDAVDETDRAVINILRFLQTLDDDADVTNGILITTTVRERAADYTMNFDQSPADFSADANVQTIINDLTGATTANTRPLVDQASALSHFRETLDEINGGGSTATEIEADAFKNAIYYTSPGIWHIDASTDSSDVTVDDNQQITITTDNSTNEKRVFSIPVIGESTITRDFCDGIGPVDATILIDAQFREIQDCTAKYFKVSDTTYRRERTCSNEDREYEESSVEVYVKVSDETGFDFGSLSFTSAQYDNISAEDGVCANTIELLYKTTTAQNSGDPAPEERIFKSTDLNISAPYVNDNQIALGFNFATNDITARIYTVVNGPTNEPGPETVNVTLRSDEFNGSGEPEQPILATDGTVTVVTVGESSVTGTYNFTTNTGDTVTGDFNVDL
jgi:hypothetical protein